MPKRGLPILRWLLMALLATVPAVGGWAWFSRARITDLPDVDRARAAYDREDWEQAAESARRALKVRRDDPEALRLLARASIRMGRDDGGTAIYRRLGVPAMQAEDLCVLGLSLTRAGQRAEAREVFEGAIALDPDHAEARFELARAYLSADRLEDASRAVAALARRPGWESRAEAIEGMIRLEQNDPAGAVDAWLRAIGRPRPTVRAEGTPTPIVPRTELARAMLRAGRPAEARDQLDIVLAGSPDPEASWLLSRVDLHRRDFDAARRDIERSGSFRDEHPMQPEPGPYAGASSCYGCHPDQARTQRASRHARTFSRADELGGLGLPTGPVPDPANPSVVHAFRRDEAGRIHQETRAGGKVFEAVVQYAFGSGDRGMTLVGREPDGRPRELRLTDYPEVRGEGPAARLVPRWDRTTGHPTIPPRADEYLGQPLDADALRRCLLCHVTDPASVAGNSGPCAADRAIGCERCHGPGANHLLAVEGKLAATDPAIARPSMVSGAPIVQLCSGCHSPRGLEVRRDDPFAARFQGTTLTWSRCYTESDDAMDCITCHDPHRNASTATADYEARCLDCHARGEHPPDRRRSRRRSLREAPTRTVCPVNPSTGCIGCHMPQVSGVAPHSMFTDHFIRVHQD